MTFLVQRKGEKVAILLEKIQQVMQQKKRFAWNGLPKTGGKSEKEFSKCQNMMEAQVDKKAVGDIFINFAENYPEVHVRESEYKKLEEPGFYHFSWEGKVSKEHKEELMKLTHHAEGIYAETGAEYVHVEVAFGE